MVLFPGAYEILLAKQFSKTNLSWGTWIYLKQMFRGLIIRINFYIWFYVLEKSGLWAQCQNMEGEGVFLAKSRIHNWFRATIKI